MRVLDNTKTKLQSAIDLASELSRGDFPNEHARQALIELRNVFNDGLDALKSVDPSADPAVVKTLCAAESAKLFGLFPYLGFLSRSTDTRNAFEIHGPLLRIVSKLLDPSSRLVISSEWEFSPFTWIPPKQTVLSDVVMIGAPASESWNALTLPLAGHELGHSVWARKDFASAIGPLVLDEILVYVEGPGWTAYQRSFPEIKDRSAIRGDLVAQSTLAPCYEWAIKQCEEVFCDCLGLLLFRESFLHAFHYLIAPGLPYRRSFLYPPSNKRALLLERAANVSGIDVSHKFSTEFDDEAAPSDARAGVLVSVADAATASVMPIMLSIATDLVTNAGIVAASLDERKEIVNNFAVCVPPQRVSNLPAIVNGAWDYYLGGMPEWRLAYPEIFSKNRSLENRALEMLSDLTFKAIEVHEIEERLR